MQPINLIVIAVAVFKDVGVIVGELATICAVAALGKGSLNSGLLGRTVTVNIIDDQVDIIVVYIVIETDILLFVAGRSRSAAIGLWVV